MEQGLPCGKPLFDAVLSVVNIPAVSDMQNMDRIGCIGNMRDQTVITDSVSPFTASVRSQRFSVNTWVFTANQILFDPSYESVHVFACRAFSDPLKHVRYILQNMSWIKLQ